MKAARRNLKVLVSRVMDGPTDEEVAAACKEGHPVTKVTDEIDQVDQKRSAGEAASGRTWRACGPDLWGGRPEGCKHSRGSGTLEIIQIRLDLICIIRLD